MDTSDKERLRIFLSSPSDVLPERNRAEAIVRRVSAELNSIDLELVRWEDSYYSAVKSFQEQIDKPSDCDLVVCLFWSKLGTELPPLFNRPDGTTRTGTEWEFEEALETARNRDPTLPDLLVYKKSVEPEFKFSAAELGMAQKRALDGFWAQWFHDEKGHFVAGFDTFAQADEFAEKFEKHLREWLRRRTGGVTWDIARQGSPFKGLAAFDESHAGVFFGRSTMIKRLTARLMAAAVGGYPLVFVLGASGSGKSSLVRAGLIPRLLIPDSTSPLVSRWRRLVVTPASLSRQGEGNLLVGLATAMRADGVLPELGQGDFSSPVELGGLFATAPESARVSVIGALQRWAVSLQASEGHEQAPVTGLILVLDQFEEIFKQEKGDSEALANAISALVESGRVWVMATLRSDFYQSLQAAPEWLAIRDRGRGFDVTPPSAADVREIILAPARAAGLQYEDNGDRSLANELEREASAPGVLPMLQSALEALFQQRDTDAGEMKLATHDELGGVEGVLAERAERAFSACDAATKAALASVLGKLADFENAEGRTTPTARVTQLADFGAQGPSRRLIEALIAERLVLPVDDEEQEETSDSRPTWSGAVRIAHENLFERWPRAREQLAADRSDLQRRRLLEQDASSYAAAAELDSKVAKGHLLDGLRLAEGLDLSKRRPDLLSEEAVKLVELSNRAAKAKSRRALTIAVALMVAFGLIAAVAGWAAWEANRQQAKARKNMDIAQQLAHELLFDVSERFRGQSGIPPALNQAITGKAREIMDRLTEGQELTVEGERTQAAALYLETRAALELGNSAAAKAAAQRALDLARKSLSDEKSIRGRRGLGASLNNWGDVMVRMENYAEARSAYSEAMDIARNLDLQQGSPESQDELALSLRKLGVVDYTQGRLSDAEKKVEESLALRRKLDAKLNTFESASNISETLASLSAIYNSQQRFLEERAIKSEIFELRRELADKLGTPEARSNLAESYLDIAESHQEEGRTSEAREAYLKAIQLNRALLDELKTPGAANNLADALHGFANLEESGRRIPEAAALFDEVLFIKRGTAKALGTSLSQAGLAFSLARSALFYVSNRSADLRGIDSLVKGCNYLREAIDIASEVGVAGKLPAHLGERLGLLSDLPDECKNID